MIARARLLPATAGNVGADLAPGLQVVDNLVLGICGDGGAIAVKELLIDEHIAGARRLEAGDEVQRG